MKKFKTKRQLKKELKVLEDAIKLLLEAKPLENGKWYEKPIDNK